MIKVTDTASQEVHRMLKSMEHEDWGVRVGVKAGGCSGLEYTMAFEEKPADGDEVFTENDVKIFVDLKSYMYLAGLELDFSTNLVGGGFQFKNPNAERTCSCGTSFSV
jgi:iron-sulfur cluster assembly protein